MHISKHVFCLLFFLLSGCVLFVIILGRICRFYFASSFCVYVAVLIHFIFYFYSIQQRQTNIFIVFTFPLLLLLRVAFHRVCVECTFMHNISECDVNYDIRRWTKQHRNLFSSFIFTLCVCLFVSISNFFLVVIFRLSYVPHRSDNAHWRTHICIPN